MLVHEARARFEGRAPLFADEGDRQAVLLLTLYHQAAAKTTKRLKVPKHLQQKLEDFQQSDADTLKTYLDPCWRNHKRRPHGR